MTEILTYANSAILALFLIAGGWVKIRNYFKDKSKAKVDAIEAEVQARLKSLQTAADASAATAGIVSGPVTTVSATGTTA